MNFINRLSYRCANYLTAQLNEKHEKRRVFYFGFQVIFGAIVKGVLIVGLALLSGTFGPTMIAIITFGSLRLISGGYHMDTYSKCIIMSLALFLAAGALVQYTGQYWTVPLTIALAIFTYLISLYVIIRWVPRDNPNRPITKPEEIKKFRLLSLIHVNLWILVMVILLYLGKEIIVMASSMGMLILMFIITPAGYIFFDAVSGKLEKIKISL